MNIHTRNARQRIAILFFILFFTFAGLSVTDIPDGNSFFDMPVRAAVYMPLFPVSGQIQIVNYTPAVTPENGRQSTDFQQNESSSGRHHFILSATISYIRSLIYVQYAMLLWLFMLISVMFVKKLMDWIKYQDGKKEILF